MKIGEKGNDCDLIVRGSKKRLFHEEEEEDEEKEVERLKKISECYGQEFENEYRFRERRISEETVQYLKRKCCSHSKPEDDWHLPENDESLLNSLFSTALLHSPNVPNRPSINESLPSRETIIQNSDILEIQRSYINLKSKRGI